MSRLLHGLALALVVLGLPLAACVEVVEPDTDTVQQDASFQVSPNVAIAGTGASNVVVDRVFLGVGSLVLEPLDDLSAPVISNRQAAALSFDMQLAGEHALSTPELEVPRAGRYLVSIAIEPQLDPNAPSDPHQGLERKSVELEGTYFSARPKNDSDPILTPEPVPWEPAPFKQQQSLDMVGTGDVRSMPFTYSSARTGYIRLGEVELSPEQNTLLIRINLDAWLDEALEPVLADLQVSSGATPTLDVSASMESAGYGLEKLFTLSETEAL